MKAKIDSNMASLAVIGVDIGKEVFHIVGRSHSAGRSGDWVSMRRSRSCRRRERDQRQDHLQTVRTELDPVDYRLEQISSSGIGQQALPQALCFSQ